MDSRARTYIMSLSNAVRTRNHKNANGIHMPKTPIWCVRKRPTKTPKRKAEMKAQILKLEVDEMRTQIENLKEEAKLATKIHSEMTKVDPDTMWQSAFLNTLSSKPTVTSAFLNTTLDSSDWESIETN